MTVADLVALSPPFVLAVGATLVMLQIAFVRSLRLTASLGVAVLLVAALASLYPAEAVPRQVGPLLTADRWALLFNALFCLAGAATALLSRDYVCHHGDEPEEFFLLLILSTLGACVLAYASHLASLLLGLELMSIALYALIAYPHKSILPLEASIKYLVLSGAASAAMLFGFALLYAVCGTLDFEVMGRALAEAEPGGGAVSVVGAAMVFAGLAFKLSVVPFHLWTPDVYDGAPSPVTGFLASVGKAAVFVVLLRLFLDADLFRYTRLVELTGLMAIFSMLAGNLLALLQSNLKRLLAYSSIAHVGYLLIVLMVCLHAPDRSLAREAAAFYLIAYTVTTIAAFGLLTLISAREPERENVRLQQISGLFWRQPLLAGLLLVAFLSLAGIPLTAGFVGKFYLFGAAVDGRNWVLLGVLIVASGIGIYYYLRVIYYMSRRPGEHEVATVSAMTPQTRLLCFLLIATILVIGILPQSLMGYLQAVL
jgi:NADH-quinone oxidoreductase subunit N